MFDALVPTANAPTDLIDRMQHRRSHPPHEVFTTAVAIAAMAVSATSISVAAAPLQPIGGVIAVIVLQVYDGDGVWLDDGDGDPKTLRDVRLFGINAPEWNRPGGQEAKTFLARLIKGRLVRCQVKLIDERYHRPIAVCLSPEGRDLACAIAWAGHATVTDAAYERCDV